MTNLNTVVLVQGEQDPWEIYNIALQQILFYDDRDAAPSDIHYHLSSEADGGEAIYASPHENLPIRLAVYHRPGGAIFTEEDAKQKTTSACGSPTCEAHRVQAAHLVLALATDLFWKEESRGWNAGHLHGGMVWSIGGFLDCKKVSWKWQDNISHELHDGYGAVEGLATTVADVCDGLSRPNSIGRMLARELMKRMGFSPDSE